jgi:hypothetical protein
MKFSKETSQKILKILARIPEAKMYVERCAEFVSILDQKNIGEKDAIRFVADLADDCTALPSIPEFRALLARVQATRPTKALGCSSCIGGYVVTYRVVTRAGKSYTVSGVSRCPACFSDVTTAAPEAREIAESPETGLEEPGPILDRLSQLHF